MRIDLCNLKREPLFSVQVDADRPPSVVKPADGNAPDVILNWDQALDDQGHLRRCPVCGCRELFVRKNFPQVTGFVIVVLTALVSMTLFGTRKIVAGFIVLGAVALIDLLIFFFTGKCVVCYRCRSTYSGIPIGKDQTGWDLSTGEKYREVESDQAATAEPRETDEKQ